MGTALAQAGGSKNLADLRGTTCSSRMPQVIGRVGGEQQPAERSWYKPLNMDFILHVVGNHGRTAKAEAAPVQRRSSQGGRQRGGEE